jgi:rhodanese-related sulfurtransferase
MKYFKIAGCVVLAVMVCITCGAVYAGDGKVCDTVCKVAVEKEGVKQITYDQLLTIKNSGEKYTLVDVLDPKSFLKGHIEGSKSLPVDKITKRSASKMLSKDAPVITYCASFECGASTQAAKSIAALGYNTLDYKGGLKEWQEKGNKLIK